MSVLACADLVHDICLAISPLSVNYLEVYPTLLICLYPVPLVALIFVFLIDRHLISFSGVRIGLNYEIANFLKEPFWNMGY